MPRRAMPRRLPFAYPASLRLSADETISVEQHLRQLRMLTELVLQEHNNSPAHSFTHLVNILLSSNHDKLWDIALFVFLCRVASARGQRKRVRLHGKFEKKVPRLRSTALESPNRASPRPPERLLAERDARLAQAETPNQAVLGDPAPDRSALAQRKP